VEAASKKRKLEEQKKKSLFTNVSNLKNLSKQEYREFHGQKFYSMPRDINATDFYHSDNDKGIDNRACYLCTPEAR
jgi:hypothetical protein